MSAGAVLGVTGVAVAVLWFNLGGEKRGSSSDRRATPGGQTERGAEPGESNPSETPPTGEGWEPVTVHYHERVPFMIRDGLTVRGVTADRLARVFDQAGVSYDWMETPPKRQLEVLQNEPGRNVLLGWFRLPEREAYARFSAPLYRDLPTIAVARAGAIDPSQPLALDDLLRDTNLRLLVRDGYSYGTFVDTHIREHAGNQVVTTVENIAMLKMIHAGRADYFFISEEERDEAIKASGLAPGNFVSLRFIDMPPGNYRYILYGADIEQELIDAVDAAIGNLFGPVDSGDGEVP